MGSQAYFEEVAGQWDQMRQRFFSDNVREVALATAQVQAGRVAADLGAGTGFMSEGLLRSGLQVIAVDQSPAMLEEMKAKFGAFDGIDYRVGEAESLPIADANVDYVFANMYLHHVERPPKAVREMVRVLRAGGRVVITDLDEHGFEFLRSEQRDRWLGFKREDVERWFIEAGLRDVRLDCVGESCCAESSSGCGSASVSIFVASGQKQ
jgi:ubiquinone/menaquinone biosynthesis C-methylase UbiE